VDVGGPILIEIGGAERVEPGVAVLTEIGRCDRTAGNRGDQRDMVGERPAIGALHLVQALQHAQRKRRRARAATGKREHYGVVLCVYRLGGLCGALRAVHRKRGVRRGASGKCEHGEEWEGPHGLE